MIYPNYYYKYNAFYNQQMRKNSLNSNTDTQDNKNDNNEINNSFHAKRISPRYNRIANFNFSNLFSSNLDEPIIEIFGIRLYFDDILILSLLLFLYEEGVKDEMLFICLILLLLS